MPDKTLSLCRRPLLLLVFGVVALCALALPAAAGAAATPTVTINPSVSSSAAAAFVNDTWVPLTLADNGWGANEMRFSSDGGTTWSTPEAFATHPAGGYDYSGEPPAGEWDLNYGLTGDATADGTHTVTAAFSTDGGTTWTATATATTILDTQPPVTGGDSGWWNSAYPYELTAVDQVGLSGVASTTYRVDAGPWNTATSSAPAGSASALATSFMLAGGTGTAHTIDFYSTDYAGNLENYLILGSRRISAGGRTLSTRIYRYDQSHVVIDDTAPTTTATGWDGQWHATPVTVSFSATDHGKSGVGSIEYSLTPSIAAAPRSWTEGNAVTVSQPGENKVWYRAIDLAQPQGNVEAARSVIVKITPPRGPKTYAQGVTATRDSTFKLHYKIVDKYSPRARSVVIVVRSSSGSLVESFNLGTKRLNTWFGVNCKLSSKGIYKYTVYAKDAAGKAQRNPAGHAKITIK